MGSVEFDKEKAIQREHLCTASTHQTNY